MAQYTVVCKCAHVDAPQRHELALRAAGFSLSYGTDQRTVGDEFAGFVTMTGEATGEDDALARVNAILGDDEAFSERMVRRREGTASRDLFQLFPTTVDRRADQRET